MFDISDTFILVAVIGLRLLVPLVIPLFPLPAILTALILDGLDQGIFADYTTLDLENYQSYDKALDVYYLSIAYLSTMRNWTNVDAVWIGRFLLYYRLVGTMIFELSKVPAILLIFPNTFEYFFVAYEAIALRWNPDRLSRSFLLSMAAFIWIVIKLPQEYWIHIAQRDMSDFLMARPWLLALLVVAGAVLLAVGRHVVIHRLPPADRSPSLRARSPFKDPRYAKAIQSMVSGRTFDTELLEKVALISLVSVIFSQMLPNVTATPMQMWLGVSVLVISNTALTELLAYHTNGWASMLRYFATMTVLNAGLAVVFIWLLPMGMSSMSLTSTLFFLLLITLLVTYYDSYRPSYLMRNGESES